MLLPEQNNLVENGMRGGPQLYFRRNANRRIELLNKVRHAA
jgi:hypothetical protein